MPITPAQKAAAQAVQHAAGHDRSSTVRLVAGPGTGKSAAIEERVRWLLGQGVDASAIWAVSFTRAAARDLRGRVHTYCTDNGHELATQVRVTTLHSLALRVLRGAGLLKAYPVEPLVLDEWELENLFDAEFGVASGTGKKRREEIRRHHEAFWSTGKWDPPNYIPPNPPITAAERKQFQVFHKPRTQTYSCVLPGELIRACVKHIKSGALDPVALLKLEHLIVDEFQDLNPLDQQFVDALASGGVRVFVAGDDDQSIYSFRFASPAGIQEFPTHHPGAGLHALTDCFRCTPAVLDAAESLITANPLKNRIAKSYSSLYGTASPAVAGSVWRWRFWSDDDEAEGIALSCRDLIAAGIKPREILILLGNKRVLLGSLESRLQAAGVEFEGPRSEAFRDTRAGRLVLALIRIVCESNDYVAHRVLLGLHAGVGPKTCDAICDAVVSNNLNFRDLFYKALPSGVFKGRAAKAIGRVAALLTGISSWNEEDTVKQRQSEISAIVAAVLGSDEESRWKDFLAEVPKDATLEELRDFLWADSDEQQAAVLEKVLTRTGEALPSEGVLRQRVRVMTMHGAKGLSAGVVFIPGLEEELIPGPWRQPYPGLVLEAARLLYVSITRARAACVMSYTKSRFAYGKRTRPTPSRFTNDLGGPFVDRTGGLTAAEVAQVVRDDASL